MSSIRQATLDDKPAIAEFLQVAYPDRHQYKFPERWEWQFDNNPFRNGDELPLWLAFDGERIVGQTGAQLEPMKLGDKSVRVGWSVDTYVLPEYRGQGIGYRLQQANQSSHDVFMSLSMSPKNRSIKASLGAQTLDPLDIFELRMSVTPDNVKRRLEHRSKIAAKAAQALRVDRLAAWIASAPIRTRYRRAAGEGCSSPGRTTIQEIDRFDDRFDGLWSQTRDCYDISVERTSRYLNWKFWEQPHAIYRRFAALVDDRLVGYAVLRVCSPPEPPLGVIVDLVTQDNDEAVWRELIIFCLEQLRQTGVERVRVATTLDEIVRTLHSLGFRRTRTYTPMCHVREEPRAKSEESRAESDSHSSLATFRSLPSALRPPLSAFFSLGDQDLDQFPRRR